MWKILMRRYGWNYGHLMHLINTDYKPGWIVLRDVLLEMAAAEADVDGEHDTCAACTSQPPSRV